MDKESNCYIKRLHELGVTSLEEWYSKVTKHRVHHTLIVGQPRSGSTLAIRLANLVCSGKVTGDRSHDFLEAYNNMLYDLLNYEYHFGSLHNEFLDMFLGHSDFDKNYYRYNMVKLLWPWPNGGVTKLTCLGYSFIQGGELLNNIRKLFEETNSELNIIFLTRDPEEIADSLVQKGIESNLRIDREASVILARVQQEHFKEWKTLDDHTMTYDELVEDPVKCLVKMRCAGYPNLSLIDNVLMKELK